MRALVLVRLWLVGAAILVGVLLRIVGAYANLQANDDHVEVIHVMANEGRIPRADEFWESFQPPFYHLVVAATIKTRPPMSRDRETSIAQAWSCVAGLATLSLLIVFIRRVSTSANTRSIAIALASLNPALISTSIQATNDAFVILFGTAALVAGDRFFASRGRGAFIALTAATLLACVTKGNGLAVVIAAVLTFVAAALRPSWPRVATLKQAGVFLVVLALVVPWGGGYLTRYAQMGSPFATSMELAPPPAFFEETEFKRPGVLSVSSGFLAFPLTSLLRDPLLEVEVSRPGSPSYPRHRTSLWTLLYGGAHSVHHPYYPGSWRVEPDLAASLVRLVALLALLPTTLLAWGLGRGMWRAAAGWIRRPSDRWLSELLLTLSAFGYLAFVAVYGYRYRDFSTMKAIFVYPAAPAFAYWFIRELDAPGGHIRRWVTGLTLASSALLAVAYMVDTGVLVRWLVVQMLQSD